jgi:hypothetical protein
MSYMSVGAKPKTKTLSSSLTSLEALFDRAAQVLDALGADPTPPTQRKDGFDSRGGLIK